MRMLSHPGSAVRLLALALALAGACAPAPRSDVAPVAERPDLRLGLEVLLDDSIHIVAGRRVGLITNPTAVASDGRHAIDLLQAHPSVSLVALFGPEHGIRGRAEAGAMVADARDPDTGLPVHSLYGETRHPTPAMLAELDVLVFDIQDIGARYYTYVSTMGLAMAAAARAGIPFVVLDRPNPIGGELVQGNVLDPAYASFVGMYPIPMRHGMTVAELARLINAEFGIGAELHVVPMAGWRRAAWYDEIGRPWIPPSPGIPALASAIHYPGTCLFEGTNLSVGRGSDRPFEQVGAPWLDGEALAARLNRHDLAAVAGARFEPVVFTPSGPSDGKYDRERVRGVRFVVTDRGQYDPTTAAIAVLVEARRLAGDRWEWRADHFDRLAGTGRLRQAIEAGRPIASIVGPWAAERSEFLDRRRVYLLY